MWSGRLADASNASVLVPVVSFEWLLRTLVLPSPPNVLLVKMDIEGAECGCARAFTNSRIKQSHSRAANGHASVAAFDLLPCQSSHDHLTNHLIKHLIKHLINHLMRSAGSKRSPQ